MEKLDQSFSSLIDYTSRNMRRYATGHLRPLGLTVDQWGVLKLIEEEGGSVSFAVLSRRLLRNKPTLTRIVDILVREALVERSEDPEDRRRQRIRLTRRGTKIVGEAALVVARLREEVIRGVSKAERDELRRILGTINRNIEAARDAQ